MQVRVKSGQTIAEPVTVKECKDYMGYSGTDQDGFIQNLITTAREFIENETGFSGVSKSYEAEFDRWDMISDDLTKVGYQGWDDGWYKLPFAPVTSITSVELSGVTTTYSQKGLKTVFIHPDTVVQTGVSNNILQVEFVAGEASAQFKTAVLRVVSDLFNNREDTGNVQSLVSFSTLRYIANLSENTSL